MKKRRKRTLSIDARIQAKAREIHASQMAVAMNAAVGMEILQKLEELNTFIAASGYHFSAVPPSVVSQTQRASPLPPQVENPCVQCGRAGVYRTKPNKFNLKGSWYCRDHAALGSSVDAEDRLDNAVLGPQAGLVIGQKPAVMDTAQMTILPQTQTPEAPPMQDALALAMGEAEVVQ